MTEEEDSDDAVVSWEVVGSLGCWVVVCWDCDGGGCEEDWLGVVICEGGWVVPVEGGSTVAPDEVDCDAAVVVVVDATVDAVEGGI